jgi:hypothetical protein
MPQFEAYRPHPQHWETLAKLAKRFGNALVAMVRYSQNLSLRKK